MKDLHMRARVVVRTSNMKISLRHLADYVRKLFFLIQPIKSSICGVVVVVAVAVVKS